MVCFAAHFYFVKNNGVKVRKKEQNSKEFLVDSFIVVREQAFQRSAIDREFREFREFREVREALPTFIPKLPTLITLSKLPNKLVPSQQSANFLSEGVRCGLDKEIALDGTYLKYFPFRAMIERSQMTPYHKKLLWLDE